VHRPIRARWLAGEAPVREAMERMAELGAAGRLALLRSDWATLGKLMNDNHALVRELGGSGEPNERLIAAALAAGAPGAKLAGAGDGGTIVALWPGGDAAPLERALRAAGAAALYRPAPLPGVRLEPVG
jgi:mevalonate kinase